jgi:cbb3-type cytochrome oxidase subunit 1
VDGFVRNFVRASLIWLGVGVLLGVAMAWVPGQALAYRAAHMHANLLGFVSMMIFGVAYHIFPRFTGNPLHSQRMAVSHLWVANAGLALLVGGWSLRVHAYAAGEIAIRGGAVLAAGGALLFIYNLWRTLGAGHPHGTPVRLRPPASVRDTRPTPHTSR